MTAIVFLVEWAVRSSVLILGAALLLWALRLKDSSIRLAAWVVVLCGSLFIPAMTSALPGLPIRVARPAIAPVATPAAFAQGSPVEAAVSGMIRPSAPAPAPAPFDWAHWVLGLYTAVALALLLRLAVGLTMSRRLLRRSGATDEPGIRESESVAAPVTLGIFRPAIVLPPDWRTWDSAKLEAVLAHERSHVRRGDPVVQLLSAVHRALLWYSPAIWFLHSRIVRVAEEASDDAALAAARDRASYAEVLLDFMQRVSCLQRFRGARLTGVPMARYGGADKRIERILSATVLSRGVTRRSVAAIVALGAPMAYVTAVAYPQSAVPAVAAQAQVPAAPAPARQPASAPRIQAQPAARPAPAARPERANNFLAALGNVTAAMVTVMPRVDGELKSISFQEGQPVQAGQVLARIDAPEFQAQIDRARQQLDADQQELARVTQKAGSGLQPPELVQQLKAKIASDEDSLKEAEAQQGATYVRAPIAGIAGLRMIEPGNTVHANATGIVTIAQVQPIAIVFTLPQDFLPRVRARMGEGAAPTVEAWNREGTARIATGHLTAIDNQIDEQTGTVKLKATFENKDGALFPNQFVNVRLMM